MEISGYMLFTGGADHTCRAFNIKTGNTVQIFHDDGKAQVGHRGEVTAMLVDGDSLFTGARDGVAFEWDITSGRQLNTFNYSSMAGAGMGGNGTGTEVTALAYDPIRDGAKFFFLGGGKRIFGSVFVLTPW